MQEFFTWGTLATSAGATAVTALITQVFKGIRVIEKIPTRLFSYIVALGVLLAGTFFSDALTLESGALCLINAVVVSLAANGAYDGIASIIQ